MLGGLGLVAGLILLLVEPPLFAQADTVGWILLLVDVVPWAIGLLIFLLGAIGVLSVGSRSRRW